MKKILLFVLMLCATGIVFAQDFLVNNGIIYEITSPKTVKIFFTNSVQSEIIIPDSVIDSNIKYAVTGIGRGGLRNRENLTSLEIPKTIVEIEELAFFGCSRLKFIKVNHYTPLVIHSDLFSDINIETSTLYVPFGTLSAYKDSPVWKKFGTILEMQTFTNNGINYRVTTPTTVEVGLNHNFKGEATIPSKVSNEAINYQVTNIHSSAFSGSELTSINLPNTIVSIGESAFEFTNLTSVVIPNSVLRIGGRAFYNCASLKSVKISSLLTNLPGLVFESCKKLTTITIPKSITSIGLGAFAFCVALKSVTVNSETPLNITKNEFYDVPISTATLYVPAGTLAAYKAAPVWKDFGTIVEMQPITFTNNGINFKVTSPTTVEITANPSFTGALNIPSSITYQGITYDVVSIANNAFAGSGITTINIPSSVITIGNYAFANLTGLTNVTVNWTSPVLIDASVFGNLPTPILLAKAQLSKPTKVALAKTNISTVTLKVPAGTKSAYQAAQVWKDFGTIIEQGTLPLNLTNFTAKATATGNQINWATANIVNVKNIVLERSGADNTFSYLTTLPVTATQFIDISPLAGDNYYRLSTIDNDGSLEVYKNIAFVKGLNNEITFYPNPITNGVLHVQAGDAKLQSVVLYDLNGKKVMVINNPSHIINTQGLTKGVYVLEINSQKGKVIKKVAVN